jgi:hypothetical protein
MVLSGGYIKKSGNIIAKSINNLMKKKRTTTGADERRVTAAIYNSIVSHQSAS